MPGRRLFVAVPLGDEAVVGVTRLVEDLRGSAGTGDRRVRGRDVRWVRLDGLHLTLRFLGPTTEDRVPAVAEAVRRVAAAMRPFEISVDHGGAFPSSERPRTLWLGVDEGEDDLAALAGALERELVEAGWPPADRPFRAHLTLARTDGVPTAAGVASRLIEAASGLALTSHVDRIVLFESITGGGAARYVPLETARLEGAGAV